ncbi:NAD(P)/FAD-dependent oxidoreductase [Roseovarius salinarum]|uniref:NAD(P)/FAD-dependent oxidoreductase n=1 Tax=Roseovarius salinarum TaxID=1981892 RepID=UPI000C321F60|nr:FAD-binding oxidoreductase [Roseovarius salinarum]
MSGGLGILWRETAAERFSAPALEERVDTDIVILGGGFTGCAAALRAAGQGADVVLLEADTVGHGGSGRNVGLVNAGLWMPPEDVCETLGRAAGERLNDVLARAPDRVFGLIEQHGIECEATRSGTLHLAHGPGGMAELRRREAQLADRGAPVGLMGPEAVHDRTGTDRFPGALHDPRAGTVQPLSYARGLARAAREAGAQVYEASPALAVHHAAGAWHVETPTGAVRARALLVATNAYHRTTKATAVPRVPVVNFFQMATEPLGDNVARDILPGREGCWDTGLVMTALRRDSAGRLILGGMGDADAAGIQRSWAARKLAQLFPQLAATTVTHAWSGRIAMTADHLPRIHRLGPDGYAVYGYSGRGIAPGTVFGEALARALLTGGEAELPLDPVESYGERMVWMKSAFFETGARIYHLGAARRR